jgi:hypothetical protein
VALLIIGNFVNVQAVEMPQSEFQEHH